MIQIIRQCDGCGKAEFIKVELSRHKHVELYDVLDLQCERFSEQIFISDSPNRQKDWHYLEDHDRIVCRSCAASFKNLALETEDKRKVQLNGFFQVQP